MGGLYRKNLMMPVTCSVFFFFFLLGYKLMLDRWQLVCFVIWCGVMLGCTAIAMMNDDEIDIGRFFVTLPKCCV